MSLKTHKLKGANGKYVRASKKARKQDEVIISESEPKVRKVESDDDDCCFECYDKWDGNAVHLDVDKDYRKQWNGPNVSATIKQIGRRRN